MSSHVAPYLGCCTWSLRPLIALCFHAIETHEEGYYFFQHTLPKKTYHYSLKSGSAQDLVVAAENRVDRDFAIAVMDQAPKCLEPSRPTVYELDQNHYGFTHAMAVPSTYHSLLGAIPAVKRQSLYMCIPIFRCEFSGTEAVGEFKHMIAHTVHAFEWGRAAHPKLSVYFDNPKTGEGAPESGALMRYAALVGALRNLDGVTNGFVEIENFNGDILEVLSPADGVYTVIHGRRDECQHSFADTLKALSRFCGMDSGRPPT